MSTDSEWLPHISHHSDSCTVSARVVLACVALGLKHFRKDDVGVGNVRSSRNRVVGQGQNDRCQDVAGAVLLAARSWRAGGRD